MAIYHLRAKIIQRSRGMNAVACAAYRRAAKLFDEKEQAYFDYHRKNNVVYSEVMTPTDAPAWAKTLAGHYHSLSQDVLEKWQHRVSDYRNGEVIFADICKHTDHKASERLWNLIETSLKHPNAQLAREIEFALPIELDIDQNLQLAREFIRDEFVALGMVADWSIHWDHNKPHVHCLLTMRTLTEDGFGNCVRSWNDKNLLKYWRSQWAAYANFHLRMHHHHVRIDHRSYQERSIDLLPSVHEGKAVREMEYRGIKTEIMANARDVHRENLSRIEHNPKILFDKLVSESETFTNEQLGLELGRYVCDKRTFTATEQQKFAEKILESIAKQETASIHVKFTPEVIVKILQAIEIHESVFTEKAIAKALLPHVENANSFARALIQIKNSPELIALGLGDDGRERFTTQKMFKLENSLQKYADKMRKLKHEKIPGKLQIKVLEHYQHEKRNRLTAEQLVAVKHILKNNAISCVVGRAGTGKSFSLGAAKAVWEARGFRVHGVALSGIAVDGLRKDADLEAYTIDSFRVHLANRTIKLNPRHVVVMDEAGMTDNAAMHAILKATYNTRAKLILVGDPQQLQPVGPGASFRALLERVGFAEIQTIYRQREDWQRQATVAFSAGRIPEGLHAYEKNHCIHFSNTPTDAIVHLVNDWAKTQPTSPHNHLVLAHRNADVDILNQQLRNKRVEMGELLHGYLVDTNKGIINIAEGERLLFLKNDKNLGVSNGRFATVKDITVAGTNSVIYFTVILDGSQKEVLINPDQYKHFNHGYAATIHKSQGVTVDRSFIYAGGTAWNRHLTYVAMTRHRDSCYLYADKITHPHNESLYKKLGQHALKDSVLDFPIAFAQRRSIDSNNMCNQLTKNLLERIRQWQKKLTHQIDQIFYPEKCQKMHDELYKNKMEQLERKNIKVVADYVDANRKVIINYYATQQRIDEMQLKKLTNKDLYWSCVKAIPEHKEMIEDIRTRNELANNIIQHLATHEKTINFYHLDESKLRAHADIYQKAKKTKEQQLTPMYKMLLHYLNTEIKQQKNMNALRESYNKPEDYQHYNKMVKTQRENLREIAESAMNHPDLKIEIKNLQRSNTQNINARGGFAAIRDRLLNQNLKREDMNSILLSIRHRSEQKSHSRSLSKKHSENSSQGRSH